MYNNLNFDNDRIFSRDEQYIKTLELNLQSKPDIMLLNNLSWYYININTKSASEEEYNESIQKAISLLKKAIRLEKQEYRIFANLGEAYFKLNQYEKANEFFLQATELSQDNFVLKNYLAVTNFHLENIALSRKFIEESIADLVNNNMFQIIDKLTLALDDLDIFSILYNKAVLLYKSAETEKCKEMAQYLWDFFKNNFISISDVDLLDMVELFYFAGEYGKVIEIYPEYGYEISEKHFGIYLSSLCHLGLSGQAFFEKTMEQIDEELRDYFDEISLNESRAIRCNQLNIKKNHLKLMFNNISENRHYNIPLQLKILDARFIFLQRFVV